MTGPNDQSVQSVTEGQTDRNRRLVTAKKISSLKLNLRPIEFFLKSLSKLDELNKIFCWQKWV